MMKEATFTPVLKKKLAGDNFGYLKIRIIEGRKATYDSLGIRLEAKTKDALAAKWNAKTQRVRENKLYLLEAKRVNEIIEKRLEEIKNQYKIEKDVKKIVAVNKDSFFSYLEKEMERLKKTNHIGTYKKRRTVYLQLKNFIATKNKTDLLVFDIDKDFVRDLEDYFIGRNLEKNTYKTYIKNFRTIYNLIMNSDEYDNVVIKNPFRNWVYELDQTDKPFLTIDELDKIDLAVIDRKDSLYRVRNYFMFCLYGQGLRVSDLKALRWGLIKEDKENLIFDFTQVKTFGKHFVFINDSLINILFDFMIGYEERINELNKIYYRVINNEVKEFESLYDFLKYKFLIAEPPHYDEIVDTYFYEELDKIENDNVYELGTYYYYTIEEQKLINEVKRKKQIELIKEYSNKHSNKFIFPLLNNEDFKNVEFGKDYLNFQQYNKSDAATAVYNKQLKRLQKNVFGDGFRLQITSHLARHTYTNIQIDKNMDLFDLSVSLGHKSLITIQMYINMKLHKERIVKANSVNGKKELKEINSEYKNELVIREQHEELGF